MPQQGVKQGHLFDKFTPVEDVKAQLDQIKGHLVWMPLRFLENAQMAEKGLQVCLLTVLLDDSRTDRIIGQSTHGECIYLVWYMAWYGLVWLLGKQGGMFWQDNRL